MTGASLANGSAHRWRRGPAAAERAEQRREEVLGPRGGALTPEAHKQHRRTEAELPA